MADDPMACWFFGSPVFELHRDLEVVFYSAWHKKNSSATKHTKRKMELAVHLSLQNYFKSTTTFHHMVNSLKLNRKNMKRIVVTFQ